MFVFEDEMLISTHLFQSPVTKHRHRKKHDKYLKSVTLLCTFT